MSAMSKESERIIREILEELKRNFEEKEDRGRPRFQISACPENDNYEIYFNIPKNVNFKFQLIFEKGNEDANKRDLLAKCLRQHGTYPFGGGNGRGGYLTLYLPYNKIIEISTGNKEKIKRQIEEEVRKVCECYKKIRK